VLVGGLARVCGPGVGTVFVALSNIVGATPARCTAFLAKVARAFSRF
jgi:hypothetical protein